MKGLKKLLASLLIICVMITSTSMSGVLAESETSNEVVQVNTEVPQQASSQAPVANGIAEGVDTPIVNITFEPLQIIEKTNGYYTTGYDSTGNAIQYYQYNSLYPEFSVTFTDGTTLTNQRYGITYNGQYYQLITMPSQSCTDPWGVGEYTVKAKLMEYETEFQLTIVESPIEKIEIEDVDVIVGTNGYNTTEYNQATGNYESYFRYNYSISNGKIYFTDGYIKSIDSAWFYHNGESYNISLEAEQNPMNQWGIGKHTITASIAGIETSYNMNIIESPYTSIEVVDVKPVIENQNCNYQNGVVIYDIPEFSFRLHMKDGSSVFGYSSNNKYGVSVTSDQYNNPWVVGGENYFTVTCPGGIQTKVKVEIQQSDEYGYYEENGEIHITEYKKIAEKVEIPSEIGGKPVVSIVSLGHSVCEMQELIIPDSVKKIELDALSYYWNSGLRKITIGSGVTYIHADMFGYCDALESITISVNNQSYRSIDGVVYDKAGETIIAYPPAKGYEYVLPASAKDIDIMYSEMYSDITLVFTQCSNNFVEEEGVLYNATKTKLISCATDKTGAFQMPSSVVEIGDYAFMNCEGLTSVSISNNVTSIAYASFMNCTALENVSLPKNLVSIEKAAFYYCLNLQSVELPNTLQTIESIAFNSSGLTEIVIPNSVNTIGDSAFGGSELANVTIGSGVLTIGDSAFSHTKIKELVIPDNVTFLGMSAFCFCEDMESVILGKGISTVRKNAFQRCKKLKKVTFVNEQVTVEDWAFSYSPIEEVNMEHVKSFGLYSFSNSKLKSISVAEGVTEIAYAAFMNSTDLGEIDVPDSVIAIGGHAFDDTAWLEKQEAGNVYLEHIYYTYKGTISANEVLEIKDGTTVIADTAFEDQELMTSISLPEGMVSIGNAAFFNCLSLTEITIPSSVKYIGEVAFAQCKNLTAIHVDPGNPYYKSIDGVLFNKDGTELIWCPKQVSGTYTVPRSVERIKSGAFGCSGPIKIVIEKTNVALEEKSIGYNCVMYMGRDYEVGPICYERVESYIVCPDNSNALQYAKDNLIEYEIQEYKPLIGDIDENGVVTSDDAVYLLYHTTNSDNYPINQDGDFNGDTIVNSNDAIYLLYHVMMPDSYPLNQS